MHTDGLQSPTEGIQALYTELALHPRKDFGWGKGKENARNLGYDAGWLNDLPDVVWELAAAVGNSSAWDRSRSTQPLSTSAAARASTSASPPRSSVIAAAQSGLISHRPWSIRQRRTHGSWS